MGSPRDWHADAVNFALDKGRASEIDLASLQHIVLSCESKDTVYRELVADRARFADMLHAEYATTVLIDEYGQVDLLDAATKLVAVSQLDRPKRRAEVEAIAHKLVFPLEQKGYSLCPERKCPAQRPVGPC